MNKDVLGGVALNDRFQIHFRVRATTEVRYRTNLNVSLTHRKYRLETLHLRQSLSECHLY